jgi:hypothetical protein
MLDAALSALVALCVCFLVHSMTQFCNSSKANAQRISTLEAENAAMRSEMQLVKTDAKVLNAKCVTLKEDYLVLVAEQTALDEEIASVRQTTIKMNSTLILITGIAFQFLSQQAIDLALENTATADDAAEILNTMDAFVKLGYEPSNATSTAILALKQSVGLEEVLITGL